MSEPEPEPEQTVRKAGRPRSAQSHEAILHAALTLFAEEGLQGTSIEAIAEQAGVGKATIYRRWSSKEALIRDALTLFRSDNELPDLGNIRADLLYLTTEARKMFTSNALIAKLVTKLIAELRTNPEIYRAFYAQLVLPRIQQFRQIIERAQERGELRSDIDTMLMLNLIFSFLVYGSIFIEMFDPYNQQPSYNPEMAVDALLRGIGAFS